MKQGTKVRVVRTEDPEGEGLVGKVGIVTTPTEGLDEGAVEVQLEGVEFTVGFLPEELEAL